MIRTLIAFDERVTGAWQGLTHSIAARASAPAGLTPLPATWNHLVGYSDTMANAANVHFMMRADPRRGPCRQSPL